MRRRELVSSLSIAALTIGAPQIVRTQTLTKMRVGIGLIEVHAQGYYALDQGFFRKNGLDVELHQLQLGAVVAEGVASGDLDAGQSNLFSILAGRQHGLPFTMIAPSSTYDVNDTPHDMLVVLKDSPVKTVKDLAGQTVGVFSIGGAQQLFVSALVDKGGGDVGALKFFPLPPNAMVAALQQGRVAAIDLSEPDLSLNADKIRPLGNTLTAISPRGLEGAWFANTNWLDKNKDAARRFADAVVQAGQWSMQNPEPAALILQKYLKTKATRATVKFGTVLDPALVQPFCDAAARYKLLQPMKATDVVWNGK
jgi:NitT/TauT family transport system substrate-binding protein